MTTAPASDNATTQTTSTDARRIDEHDADYRRLRDATVRRLLASLRLLMRDLRARPHDDQSAASAFIQRHTAIMREAYLAAHREGARDYYDAVSRTPVKWAATVEPSERELSKRLMWYAAPSVAKMAHEALTAARQGYQNTGRLTEAPSRGSQDATGAIRLDDPAGGDPLQQWFVGMTARANLQAEITWSGLHDGYGQAGGQDGANPYALLYWDMEPFAQHCSTCPEYAAASPYDPPGSGGNELDATPGDGHTECGAACKCSLRYGPMPTEDFRTSIWDSPGAPPAPGGGLKWPNVQPPPRQLLEARQQKALDDYRAAEQRWERVRGGLPDLPAMFDPESKGANWPEWDALTGAQRLALQDVYKALADWERAAGAVPLEHAVAGNATAQADLAAHQRDLNALADHLDRFVAELNAAAKADQLDRFGVGVFRMWLRNLEMDFEEELDWFYGRGLAGQQTDAQLEQRLRDRLAQIKAEVAKAEQEAQDAGLTEDERGVLLGGHQPGYTQNRGAHGRWAPGDGGEGGTEGGGVHAPHGIAEHGVHARGEHGGGGGGRSEGERLSAFHDAVDRATTTAEVSGLLQRHLRGGTLDGEGPLVGLRGAHVDAAKAIAHEMADLQHAYPEAMSKLHAIVTEETALGARLLAARGHEESGAVFRPPRSFYALRKSGGIIALRTSELVDRQKGEDGLRREARAGRKAADPEGSTHGAAYHVAHEFGHHLSTLLGHEQGGVFAGLLGGRRLSAMHQRYDSKALSSYAGKNAAEHWAEAFAASRHGTTAMKADPYVQEQQGILDAAKAAGKLAEVERGAMLGGHPPGYNAQPHGEHGHWGPGQGSQEGEGAGIGGGVHVPHGADATHGTHARGERSGGGAGGRTEGEGSAHVEYASALEHAYQRGVFGRDLADHEVAALVGAGAGARVQVHHGGLITATHADGSRTEAFIHGEDDGRPGLHLLYQAHGEDLGAPYDAARLGRMVEAAHALGIHTITTKGRAGSLDHVLLPRLGFDTSIGEALHESRLNPTTGARAPEPPRSFTEARSLSDALTHADARAWWEANGLAPHWEFDTTPGSGGRAQLAAAIAEQGGQG